MGDQPVGPQTTRVKPRTVLRKLQARDGRAHPVLRRLPAEEQLVRRRGDQREEPLFERLPAHHQPGRRIRHRHDDHPADTPHGIGSHARDPAPIEAASEAEDPDHLSLPSPHRGRLHPQR